MHIKHMIFILYILPPFPGDPAVWPPWRQWLLLLVCVPTKKMLSSFIFLQFEL